MKKKLLVVSIVVFLLLISPLVTQLLNAWCAICTHYGECTVGHTGWYQCWTSGGPLSMCIATGGECGMAQ